MANKMETNIVVFIGYRIWVVGDGSRFGFLWSGRVLNINRINLGPRPLRAYSDPGAFLLYS